MRKRSIWIALLLVLALTLSGCGAAQNDASRSGGSPGGRGAAGVAPSAPAAESPAPSPGEGSGAADSGSLTGGTVAPALDRKIIQNAEVELSVKDVDEALGAIRDALERAGGYVQDNQMSGTREQGRRVTMRVRVPAGAYGSLLDLLRSLGEVHSLHQWTNDVTEEYLDLEARIETAEAHLAQLNKLYERSGSVTEMIELEREIARVTADLESLKGRYNFLANQVAFSTISISLYEPGVPAPSRSPQTLGERMRDAFLFSWNATIAAAQELLIWLVALIPGLLFLVLLGGIIALLIWLIVRAAQGRRRPPGAGAGGAQSGPGPGRTSGPAQDGDGPGGSEAQPGGE